MPKSITYELTKPELQRLSRHPEHRMGVFLQALKQVSPPEVAAVLYTCFLFERTAEE